MGFVGVGRMDLPIVGHVLDAGHQVRAYDISIDALEAAAERGAQRCNSPKDVATGSDVVLLSPPHPEISSDVILGKERVLTGLASGTLIADTSTVSPGSGQSAQTDDRLRKYILPRNFTPGMTTELATKGSVLCLELTRGLGVPTFIASAAHHVYEIGIAKGYG